MNSWQSHEIVVEKLVPANPKNKRRTMKMKTISAKIMTKGFADGLAKEIAFRGRKAEGGIAARREQTKGNGK